MGSAGRPTQGRVRRDDADRRLRGYRGPGGAVGLGVWPVLLWRAGCVSAGRADPREGPAGVLLLAGGAGATSAAAAGGSALSRPVSSIPPSAAHRSASTAAAV